MFTLTLLGDAIISIVLTSQADKMGRKKTLIISSVLAIFTSLIFASQSNFWVLLVSAIIGVISPSGNEIGPFMAIELSGMLQNLTSWLHTSFYLDLYHSVLPSLQSSSRSLMLDYSCGHSLRICDDHLTILKV